MARGGREGRRADYNWNGLSGGSSVTNAAIVNGFAVAVMNTAGTIVRTRGEVLVMMDVGAGADTIAVAMGLMVLPDAVVAAAGTAFPSPSEVLDGDWLWHGFALLRSETGTQSDDLSSHVQRLTIDSKAMRKVKANDQLVFIFDGVVLVGSPTYDIVMAGRTLLAS